ncbi:transcriptional regulator [Devosia sp. Root413D1]|uniref:ATP-binding protein n=1 Tax=Devosia sp. Root413D1 TaxID=1736531 RepID=UPI0006FCFAA1|nr:winged helix-turn-helix domain-containing protein [Devosia sp. Root413D1]KQW77626.1 transcriptional regulator [Devosia sp. Root413D1]
MGDSPRGKADRTYRFGPFRLLPQRRLLLRDGVPVRIGSRAFDILAVLVARSDEVVGKRELMALVWPTLFVEESNLKVNMNALRRALGDAPDGAQYVATVIGRGYRFVAAVVSEAASDAGALPGAVTRTSNLPTPTTRIVGRRAVIEATHRDLAEARLVSLVGPGGIGKTTVALAVGEGELARHRDGVWLVDLSPLVDPLLIPNAIATAIGLSAHSANMLEALCQYLRERDLLLLLDSCEHLVDGVAAVADRILAESVGTAILATSREPLRVQGERVRRLPGLAAPTAAPLTAAEALDFPAIQLFVDRAVDGNEAFALTDSDAPIAAEICRRLDGLALAIELAAPHVEALGVTGVLQALEDRFSLLEGRRGGPERHRTLLATIDWSYHLLSASEQKLMRRLSVFQASFSLNSACGIAIDVDRPVVTRDLGRLVAKSLVTAEVHDSAIAYRQLDSTRAYALEKLAESGEIDVVRRRLAEHCIVLLSAAEADIERLSRTDWLTRYAGKVDDIRAALRWTFDSSATRSLGVRLTVAAIPFGKQLSLIEEIRIAVERALEPRLAPYRSSRDELLLNLTLGATLLHSRGPLLAVKAALSRALGLAEELGDTSLQLECLRGLSEYELWTGDSRAAMAVSERIRAIEGQGQQAAAGDADAQAGSALHWLGALGAARHRLEGIAHKPFAAGQRPDAMRFEFDQRLIARGALATVMWLQGFPDQAVQTARQQLADAEASNYAVSLCSALLHGSLIIAMYVRDYVGARHFLQRGIDHATRHGLTIWRAMAAGGGARLDLYTSRPIDLGAFRDTLAEVRDGGFRMRYPNYLTNFGEALARQGDLEAGLAAIDEALAICRDTGQVVGIPEILRIKGNVIRFQSPDLWESAAELYRQAIELARRDYALGWELRAATSLVKLTRLHGGDAAAEAGLAATLGRFTEGFGTGDVQRARLLVAGELG